MFLWKKDEHAPVRIYGRILDTLEEGAVPGLNRHCYRWNHVELLIRSVTPADDLVWKPFLGQLEPDFLKRLRRLECDLPQPFRLKVKLDPRLAEPFEVRPGWSEKIGAIARLSYGEQAIDLTGQTVVFGRGQTAPFGLPLDGSDPTISREHGRVTFQDGSYWCRHESAVSRTRILREGQVVPVLIQVPRRLSSGDRILCGKGQAPILYSAVEEE